MGHYRLGNAKLCNAIRQIGKRSTDFFGFVRGLGGVALGQMKGFVGPANDDVEKISAGGLGEIVLKGITQMKIGLGFEGGIAVVILAIILDRITQGMAGRKNKN